VERVYGEHAGYECTAPGRPRHSREGREEQQRCEAMEDRIRKQGRSRIRSEELDTHQERELRQRDPVAVVDLGQRPAHGFRVQTRPHVGVLDDVDGIVQENELVVAQRVVDERYGEDQEQAQAETSAETAESGFLCQLHIDGEDTP